MGLAPYGEDVYSEELRQIVTLGKSLFTINNKFIDIEKAYRKLNVNEHHKKVPSLFTPQMAALLGSPRSPTDAIGHVKRYCKIYTGSF